MLNNVSLASDERGTPILKRDCCFGLVGLTPRGEDAERFEDARKPGPFEWPNLRCGSVDFGMHNTRPRTFKPAP